MSRSERRWELAAVGAALVLALTRETLFGSQMVRLLARSWLHDTSLSRDALVVALRSAPFGFAMAALGRAMAWLSAHAGGAPEGWIAAVLLAAWIGQALWSYRLAVAATGSREAGFFAALFVGAEMPIALADAPYNIQGIVRRAVAMPVLLWGLEQLFRGRRGRAWVGVAASTYLHATPGLYLWPFLAIEEMLGLRRDPKGARRLLAGLAAALPMLWAVTRPGPTLDPDFVRMDVSLHAYIIGGRRMATADAAFMIEGLLLTALALWRARGRPMTMTLMRMVLVAAAFLAFGTLSWKAFLDGWPGARLWLLGCRMQPWVTLGLIDLVGQLALAAWLAEEPELSPLFAVLLAFSAFHDVSLRLVLLALGGAVVLRRRTGAWWIAAGAAFPSVAMKAVPGAMAALGRAAGLHGGLFASPAFQPLAGLTIVVILSSAALLKKRRQVETCALAAIAFLIVTVARRLEVPPPRPPEPLARMAEWIEANTEPSAVVLPSPLPILDEAASAMDFMARSRRSAFAISYYAISSMHLGALSAPLADHLKALGFDFTRVCAAPDLLAEFARIDAGLTPKRADALARDCGVSYVLARAGRPWPDAPVHVEGPLALFRARQK